MKKYLVTIGLWMLPLIIIFAFPRDLPGITCLGTLLFPLVGFILLVTFLVLLFKSKHKRHPAIALLLVLLIVISWFKWGFIGGARLHLLMNQSRYQATVTKLSSAHSPEERKQICGEACQILSGEPLRVNFHYCHCFLYWPDIVYDPTGALDSNNISKLHQIDIYLFKGEHLSGNWYIGYFGD